MQKPFVQWKPFFSFWPLIFTISVNTQKSANLNFRGRLLIGTFLCDMFLQNGNHFSILVIGSVLNIQSWWSFYTFVHGLFHLTTSSLVKLSTYKCDDLSAHKHLCVVPFTFEHDLSAVQSTKQSIQIVSHICA